VWRPPVARSRSRSATLPGRGCSARRLESRRRVGAAPWWTARRSLVNCGACSNVRTRSNVRTGRWDPSRTLTSVPLDGSIVRRPTT
jgi:hypothetical protein